MDKEMMAKEMLKDFIVAEVERDRTLLCPFATDRHNIYLNVYHHDLCAILFPRWAKKHMHDDGLTYDGKCPCMSMSQSYVRRKARAFVKKN